TDTFTYVASNGTVKSDVATVAITVGNRPVRPQGDKYDVTAAGVNIAAGSLAANDANADNVPVKYYLVPGNTPDHAASFALNLDGSFVYVSKSGYAGLDHFGYYVNDGTADSNPANVVLAV